MTSPAIPASTHGRLRLADARRERVGLVETGHDHGHLDVSHWLHCRILLVPTRLDRQHVNVPYQRLRPVARQPTTSMGARHIGPRYTAGVSGENGSPGRSGCVFRSRASHSRPLSVHFPRPLATAATVRLRTYRIEPRRPVADVIAVVAFLFVGAAGAAHGDLPQAGNSRSHAIGAAR